MAANQVAAMRFPGTAALVRLAATDPMDRCAACSSGTTACPGIRNARPTAAAFTVYQQAAFRLAKAAAASSEGMVQSC